MDDRGETHECRTLLDHGSEGNIIKTSFAKRLNLSLPYRAVISDVDATDDPIHESAPNLVSKCGFHTSLTCLLIDRITSNVPNFRISESVRSTYHSISS